MTGSRSVGASLTRRRHVDLVRVGSAICPRPRTARR
ncbi:putative leader peptide [Blastococcus sp. LR1]